MRTPYSPSVLISGAGVAGLVAAHFLHHAGWRVTVVERAPSPRPGGQALDVRGAALTVVDRMGLSPELRAARTDIAGMSMLDGDGHELMRSTEFALSSGRLDSPDVEALRDDLMQLFSGAVPDGVTVRYGEHVTGLEQDDRGVTVRLSGGRGQRHDLVVGADGLRSGVRRLLAAQGAWGDLDPVRHLGAYVGVFSAPNFLGLSRWQTWLRAGRVGYAIYTARGDAELRLNLGFESPPLDHDRSDVPAQKQLLARHIREVPWQQRQLLDHLDRSTDFWFDAMAQVHLPHWSVGRVVLIGDAGYCPSPLSGQGTSLALVGAHVLAGELGRGDDIPAALQRYEARMRPFVTANQALVDENPGGPPAPESIIRAASAIDLGTAGSLPR